MGADIFTHIKNPGGGFIDISNKHQKTKGQIFLQISIINGVMGANSATKIFILYLILIL